jgi:hypothetical protein
MIGLGPATRDHGVCPARLRLGKQELELAHLVAGELDPGEIIALDVKLYPQHLAGARQMHERCGQTCQ